MEGDRVICSFSIQVSFKVGARLKAGAPRGAGHRSFFSAHIDKMHIC